MLISTSNNISTRTYQTGDIMNTNITSRLIPGIGRHPFPAYRGRDKYIFVSYAHDDKDLVFQEIARYQYMKYNVWYDEGISPGNEWKEDIAEHLTNSDLFIIFLTKNTAKSENCRIEFYCALNNSKPIIPIYMEDFDTLPVDDEWKRDLSEIQGILMTTLDEEEYIFKFTEAFQKFGFRYGGIEMDEARQRRLLEELEYYDDAPWKRVTLFIDGTFIDSHAERDYLLREVFPELIMWCRQRRIHLTYMDLRWGITETETNDGIFKSIFERIDKCSPFYLCLLGQFRGWVPDFDNDISAETAERYSKIARMEGMSATEMGIEYALARSRHLIFLHRNPAYLHDLTDAQMKIYTNAYLEDEQAIRQSDEKLAENYQRLRDLKELEDLKPLDERKNIQIDDYDCQWNREKEIYELKPASMANGTTRFDSDESKGMLTNFTCNGQPLKDVIIEQVKEAILMEFPEHMAVFSFEKEFTDEITVELANYGRSQNEMEIGFSVSDIHIENDFCYQSTVATVQHPKYDGMIRKYLKNDDNRICLVSGDEGYGKTTLLSNLAESLKDDPNVYARFCGISKSSSDIYSLWTSIIVEAMVKNEKTRFYSYPLNYFDLFSNFNQILNELSLYGDTVIIIDGADHLDRIMEFLKIVHTLPKNMKIIVSIENDPQDESYTRRLNEVKSGENIYSIELEGLTRDEEKALIISEYLDLYGKRLDDHLLEKLCSLKYSHNPLFLKIILSELIDFGSYDHLTEKIESFEYSLSMAFNRILERIGDDYLDFAYHMFFLFEVDFTLSPEYVAHKISRIMETSDEEAKSKVNSMLVELDDFVRTNENGCIFLNRSLKNAIKKRYG